MHNPSSTHFVALKQVLRYLKGTLSYDIHLKAGILHLIAYLDADWEEDPTDRRSTAGICVFFGSNPVSWSAKK